MAFDLIPDHVEAKSRFQSSGNVVLAAGQSIRIESTPGGQEFLDWTAPPGKVWTIDIGITVHEEDE